MSSRLTRLEPLVAEAINNDVNASMGRPLDRDVLTTRALCRIAEELGGIRRALDALAKRADA